MLGLRLAAGLDPADHPGPAWHEVESRFGEAFLAAHAQGRLERPGRAWRVPAAHRFVADDVIAWLAARARVLAVEESAA